MKMKKRIIALLLAVLLAVGLIGCKDVLKGIVHKATGTSDEVQEEDTTRWADATAMHNGLQLYFNGDFFFLRNCHLLFCLCKTEEMTCSKDASVNNCNKQITVLYTVASKPADQWHCYDIDDSDCDHCRYRTRCIDLGTLINILCHSTAKCSIWNVYTGVS